MFSRKIHRLIGRLGCGAGISLLWFGCSPKQIEKPPEIPIQTSTRQTAASDSRFEGVVRSDNLQAETDALLPLFDQMPSVPVYLKDEPILKSGTNTATANAYTHCDGGEFPFIFVKKIYYRQARRKRLVNTLKHELTHAWLCRQRLMAAGHDALFRRKFEQVGGWGNFAEEH